MSYEFHLPDIGEGTADAEVVRWLVQIGDTVTEDQPVAEVETDKAVVVMPAPVSGRIAVLGAAEGDRIDVGALLLTIEQDDTTPTSAIHRPPPPPVAEPGTRPPEATTTTPAAPARGGRVVSTPATRRLARDLGVDLVGLTGTGPGGRIGDDDVRRAAEKPPGPAAAPPGAATGTAPPEPEVDGAGDRRIPVRGVRRRTAEAMVASAAQIPHTVAMHAADVDPLLGLLRQLRPLAADRGVALTLTAFLVKATALALVQHPMANSSFDPEAQEIVVRRRRNIGVAVNTPDGLVIPVLHDADAKPVLALARELAAVMTAARERRSTPADLQGGTFTLTNHGPLGGAYGTPIIRAPEAGILGFGRAVPQPVVREGSVAIATMLPISFSSDHRIVDGDLAIGFCLSLIALLEDPLQLLVEEG